MTNRDGPPTIAWRDLGTTRIDAADGATVEIEGVPASVLSAVASRHFVLVPESLCCPGCLPRDALGAIEVFAAAPVSLRGEMVRMRGTLRIQSGSAWRYRLENALPAKPPGWATATRRRVLAAGPLMCLAACDPARSAAETTQRQADARAVLEAAPCVDIHSHAGGLASRRRIRTGAPLDPVAPMMRDGGMAAICLAVVSDGPTHRVMADGRIHPYRDPDPGELYQYGQSAFQRLHDAARDQGLAIIRDRAGLRAARAGTASVIVAAEGADFLEGRIDRIDEAFSRWSLRHLQLTHYRVNELGDIQTEAPVHGGLTAVGEAAIRRCNQLGIVVDVAHGTYDLVKRAVTVTTRPLVLSHTSLTANPGMRSRLISPQHALAIAATGGVIGVWPPESIYGSLTAMATGMARLVNVVGVDHVGLGSDMRGLVGASVFPDYGSSPGLAEALLSVGFGAADAGKILGGNYRRVFEATMV